MPTFTTDLPLLLNPIINLLFRCWYCLLVGWRKRLYFKVLRSGLQLWVVIVSSLREKRYSVGHCCSSGTLGVVTLSLAEEVWLQFRDQLLLLSLIEAWMTSLTCTDLQIFQLALGRINNEKKDFISKCQLYIATCENTVPFVIGSSIPSQAPNVDTMQQRQHQYHPHRLMKWQLMLTLMI
jgi:signal transduction histidine kinase